ncbi:MAG: PKD domain-containing protein, partial [Actinobacteria bacterium]|nr:PKD domain-containing protein [Actinomycetota bacterium]
NDLRGKILRIHPEADGSHSIPPGNLFAPGTPLTRPEIYAMGLRNPFRIDVDSENGRVYIADYGPDAPQGVPGRGPAGQVEWNLLEQAANLGWPYCHANNEAYNDFDFETGTPGPAYDCNAPVNDSPNNTGLTNLPPTHPPVVWYGYTESAEFPEMGAGSSAPMAGPAYHYDPAAVSDVKFPAYFDDVPFFYEWGRGFIAEFRLDADGGIHKINQLFPIHDFSSPIDVEFGPDGALYVLEWGTGFDPSNDPTQELVRVEYRPELAGNRSPVARASAVPSSGASPLSVDFSSAGSSDPDGDAIAFAWDFSSDGSTDSTAPNPRFTYSSNGNFNARLTVTDATNRSAVANVPIAVGNTRPVVSIAEPPNGGFFDFGDFIRFSVDVQDPEDGAIDCADVRVQPEFGHAQHSHPLQLLTSCAGYFRTRSDE